MTRSPHRQSVLSRFFSVLLGFGVKRIPDGPQTSTPPQPLATSEHVEWQAYWKAYNQPWRTEPEIDMKRQEELAQRRISLSNSDNDPSIYSFEKIQLNRADLEWLLASHENGNGPINWNDEDQREREGLDLRGTDLRYINLQKLPLTGIYGGLTLSERLNATEEQCEKAAIQLEGANLRGVHLEGARLYKARLQGSALYDAYLQNADLTEAHLEGVYLNGAHLEGAILSGAHLEGANLNGAHLEGAILSGAHLEGATLIEAHLEKVDLNKASLERTDIIESHLEGADLSYAFIGGATLSLAFFDNATRLDNVTLSSEKYGVVSLTDVSWGDVNLAVVKWPEIKMLGNEYVARSKIDEGKVKEKATRLVEYEAAVRAYRQLSVALQGQGLNEDAARFAYRAQLLQKKVFRLQIFQQGVRFRQRLQVLGAWLFSWFLFLIAGYGYKLWRSLLAYLFIIGIFTGLYVLTSQFATPHLKWDEALVFSMSSFHGRGFFPQNIALGDTYARIAVVEGFVGLFVEVTLIATFTQRFFGK